MLMLLNNIGAATSSTVMSQKGKEKLDQSQMGLSYNTRETEKFIRVFPV